MIQARNPLSRWRVAAGDPRTVLDESDYVVRTCATTDEAAADVERHNQIVDAGAASLDRHVAAFSALRTVVEDAAADREHDAEEIAAMDAFVADQDAWCEEAASILDEEEPLTPPRPYTRDEFTVMRDQLFDLCRTVNDRKGHDYAGEDDALANFKRGAARFGLTPVQVWGVYAFKHIDAIATFVREGQVESEPIEGRIVDAINYLTLLYALVNEGGDQ